MMHGWINNFTVDSLKYITPGKEPLTFNDLSATILWRQGTLYVSEINVKTSSGTVKGSGMIDLARPALQAHLRILLQKAVAGIDTISLDAGLPTSKGEEQIAGPVLVKAATGARERFNLECRVAVARHAIRISRAKLTEKDRKGSVEADGILDLSGNKPAFNLSAKIIGLDLTPELKVATDLSGSFDISGTMEDFRGKLDLEEPRCILEENRAGGEHPW